MKNKKNVYKLDISLFNSEEPYDSFSFEGYSYYEVLNRAQRFGFDIDTPNLLVMLSRRSYDENGDIFESAIASYVHYSDPTLENSWMSYSSNICGKNEDPMPRAWQMELEQQEKKNKEANNG